MRMHLNRKIALFMSFVMVIPLLWNMNAAVVKAATPSFAQTSIELVGAGETYNLDIMDKVAKSKYSWSSSDTKVATVTTKGLVTSVDKGVATIKCKITYPSKKTKTLSCKVTVTIPATGININNHVLVNGAQVMRIGDTMDFNCDLVPANTSDVVFWSAKGDDPGCIRIDNEKEGRITAVKAGKAILVATAAKTSDAGAAAASIIDDAVIIEVVGPTATVKSADIIESNKIQVVFDSPINPATVIGDKGVLSGNIEVTMSRDIKGVVADDPGKLTASLSSDGLTLTILSEKQFNGYYGINFTSNILTIDGIALESYYKSITYTDNTPPAYLNYTTDDTGRIVTINFNEPLNFSNMRISGASLVTSTGETASTTTLNILNNVLNYVISEDKKSMTINLSTIPTSDLGKTFSIIISGITDMSGNTPANAYIQAFLRTEINKSQARCLYVRRTGYNTLTAFFDRSIQTGGLAQIAGGPTMAGIVDINDSKKVNYIMSAGEAAYTGIKTVSVGFWSAYNVDPNDTSASRMWSFSVDFTADVTSPFLVSNVYDAKTGILTLTYNEDVIIAAAAGVFSSTFTSVTDEIIPNTNISYTSIAHTEGNKVIKLKLTGMTKVGTYRFTMSQGFVTDSFNNGSIARELIINNDSGELSELPAPYSIIQNTDDLSKITIKFVNKLDIASASAIANYRLPGITIISALVTENTATSATVALTVADGSIKQEIDYPFTISGVKGYNNSYTAIVDYKYSLHLKENVKPTYLNAIFDTTTLNSVKLNFSEPVKGTMTFRVTQVIGATTVEIPVSAVNYNGSSITIVLSVTPNNHGTIFVYPLTNAITDMSGNQLALMPVTIPVVVSY